MIELYFRYDDKEIKSIKSLLSDFDYINQKIYALRRSGLYEKSVEEMFDTLTTYIDDSIHDSSITEILHVMEDTEYIDIDEKNIKVRI